MAMSGEGGVELGLTLFEITLWRCRGGEGDIHEMVGVTRKLIRKEYTHQIGTRKACGESEKY